MEAINQQFPWLELMDRPGFCVKDGVVIATNVAAQNRGLRLGTEITQIVTEHRSTYESFDNGQLYLTIQVGDSLCSACVTRTAECDIFIFEDTAADDQLQALALAAQQLRIPLSNVMLLAGRLLNDPANKDSQTQHQINQMNQNLFQLLRIISNMSDAGTYRETRSSGVACVDLVSVFDEIMEKAQSVSERTGRTICYSGLNVSVFSLANAEKLERAVYNLLSNAINFSPVGSTIEAKLTKTGNCLSFTLCNPSGEPEKCRDFWKCYRREPAIEDGRYGLGLGITLVNAVAASHGGTVLMDHPEVGQTRVTMTLPIVNEPGTTVRSRIIQIGDYAGGWDKALLELSQLLPADSYENIN